MNDKQFSELMQKLDSMSRLLALNIVAGKKFIDQVAMLSSAGFKPKEIADMLGKTSTNVRVQLVAIRKRKRSGKANESTSSREGGENGAK